nr:hypothetical protein [Tanacetum cinerariifolium]GEW50869.1 hypothetical protein [Tanacetum cinerariifolium]
MQNKKPKLYGLKMGILSSNNLIKRKGKPAPKDLCWHHYYSYAGVVLDGGVIMGIRELNYESMSEPKLQVPLSSVSLPEDIGSSAGDVGVMDNMPNDPCTCDLSSSGGIQELRVITDNL